jgi:pimeloyl-ACP methyl ester carboxylesterase
MSDGEVIVLLHGSANGSYSWGAVARALARSGATVIAPDMLGYGTAPPPSASWTIDEESTHLERAVARYAHRDLHLVAHSLGTMFALHLLPRLKDRVTRLTLIDPVMVSVLRQTGEIEAGDEMEAQYQRFMGLLPDEAAAARAFVEHWSGSGSWSWIGNKARAVITALVPKVRLEIIAARSDTTPLETLLHAPPPTTILVGERTRLAPRAVARQLARATAADTIVVAGAGHMIPLTHPEAVVAALSDTPDESRVAQSA